MSLATMRQELLGTAGNNFGLATTKINESFAAIQNENVWSFQLQQGGWFTPGLLGGPNTNFLSPGLATVAPFSATVTGDLVASQTWQATPRLTQQQFRVPYYSLYNIIALGTTGVIDSVTLLTPGSGQMPGTYIVPVLDADGTGVNGLISITVAGDGTVHQTPIILNAGTDYGAPGVIFNPGGSQGWTAATFSIGMLSTLTLDRPWMEPNQINSGYMIYQAYFAAPPGFKRWYYFEDTTNNAFLDWWSYTQINLAEFDAQRVNFLQPSHVVPYAMDTRQGSATYGQMLYELWPHPIMQLPYTFGCQANWPALVNPTDTVPYPLTDELVKMRAYEMLYLWKESQRGDEMERGSGANWQFLSQAMRAEYTDRLKRIRIMDRHLVDLYFTRMRRGLPVGQQVFGTVTGQASVGGWNS